MITSPRLLRILLDKHRADFKFAIYMAHGHGLAVWKIRWLSEAAYHRRQIADIKRMLNR